MNQFLHAITLSVVVATLANLATAAPPPAAEGPIIKFNGADIGVATARVNGAGRLLIKTHVHNGSPNGNFTVVANGIALGQHTNNKHGRGTANFNLDDADEVLQGGVEILLEFVSPGGFSAYSSVVTLPL